MNTKIGAALGAVIVMLGVGVAVPAQAVVSKPPVATAKTATPPAKLPDGKVAKNQISTKSDFLTKGTIGVKGNPRPTDGPVKGGPSNSVKKAVPGNVALLDDPEDDVFFKYVYGRQTATSDGTYANLRIEAPYWQGGVGHTLAEISAQSAVYGQIVEVGWTVDPVVNGGCTPNPACLTQPHLFVYHWVNGVGSCYNGCGFVAYGGATITPGNTAVLPTGVAKQFGIQHYGGAWWISYDSQWVGYFPDALWSGASTPVTFTQAGFTQYFGEVATLSANPCADMGSGTNGSVGALPAAYFSSVSLINGPAVSLTFGATTPSQYNYGGTTKRTFFFGGAGATSTGSTPGNIGSC